MDVTHLLKKEKEDVVLDVDWDELFSSVPSHQSVEVHPHFMATFAVHWNHETTVGSQLEIFSSFARDFSSSAQHFVYTSESTVQRSTQTVSIVTLKTAEAPPKKIHSLRCCSIETSISLLHLDQSSMEMWSLQLLCPGSRSPFNPLRTAHGTKIKTSK